MRSKGGWPLDRILISSPGSPALRALPRSSPSYCRTPIEYFREMDLPEYAIHTRRIRLFHRVRNPAFLVVVRYLAYLNHPADVAAYGGMWAGGDLMLELFIVCMFLVVTFFLVLVIAKSEAAYTIYSKALVGISLTAPLSVALIAISGVNRSDSILYWIVGYACMFRLFASPLVAFGMGMSRLFARFPRAKRLTVYALAIEGSTIILLVGSLFFAGRGHS